MKISSFLSFVEQFSADQKRELAHLSGMVSSLYDMYGDRLVQDTFISEIKSIHPDAAACIELISSTIGLQRCSELHSELIQEVDSIVCSYHSDDVSLLSHLSAIQEGSIVAQWNEEIGVKIQSTSGKSYERTLEKDIEYLSR